MLEGEREHSRCIQLDWPRWLVNVKAAPFGHLILFIGFTDRQQCVFDNKILTLSLIRRIGN